MMFTALTDATLAHDQALLAYFAAKRAAARAKDVLLDLDEQDVAGNDPRVEAALVADRLAQRDLDAAYDRLKQATAAINALLGGGGERR